MALTRLAAVRRLNGATVVEARALIEGNGRATIPRADGSEYQRVGIVPSSEVLDGFTQIVEDYAPGAPAGLREEATLRTLAWWGQQSQTNLSSQSTGDHRLNYMLNRMSPFRHSGAMALLSPFKRRRAGRVG